METMGVAEVSCLHGWYTGLQVRFLDDPIVFIRKLWWGSEFTYTAPAHADVFGVCLFT